MKQPSTINQRINNPSDELRNFYATNHPWPPTQLNEAETIRIKEILKDFWTKISHERRDH